MGWVVQRLLQPWVPEAAVSFISQVPLLATATSLVAWYHLRTHLKSEGLSWVLFIVYLLMANMNMDRRTAWVEAGYVIALGMATCLLIMHYMLAAQRSSKEIEKAM